MEMTYIYRLEHSNGYGLFFCADKDNIKPKHKDRLDNLTINLSQSLTKNKIYSPHWDDKIKDKFVMAYYFAFSDIHIMRKCLKKYFKSLYECDITAYRICIHKINIIEGDGQVMYMKGDVIEKERLSLETLLDDNISY